MYSIDFDKLIDNLLPWFLRKPVMKSWLKATIAPTISLYGLFTAYIDKKRWEASLTGQVEVMEIMLNQEFYNDANSRKIFISDNDPEEMIYIHNLAENQSPFYLHNLSENEEEVYLSNLDEGIIVDFIVNVPEELEFDLNYMISLIKKYKIAGPSFEINTYQG